MKIHRRNGNTTIIGIVVAVVVLLGIVLYISDPLRTKAESAYKDFTEWTPAQIRKDPSGYLNFAEKQVKAAKDKLKDSQISIAQQKAKLVKMKQDADSRVELGSKALNEIRDLYKAALPSNQFPIKWKKKEFKKEAAGQQIIRLDTEVKSKKSVSEKVEGALNKLEKQLLVISQQEAKCDKQLADIKTNREMIEVDKITDSLADTLVDLNTTISATVASVSEESNTTFSLDDLEAEEAGTVDEDELAKILAE